MKRAEKEQLIWMALSTGAVIGATVLTRKGTQTAWRQLRGEEPPQHAADPTAGWRAILVWAGISGLSVAVARLAARGLASKAWQKQLGRTPPGD